MEYQPRRIIKANPIRWAIDYSHPSFVQRIISQLGFSRLHPETSSALHLASEKGNTEIIEILISAGYDVNGKVQGTLPLHTATMNGHAEAVKVLLAHGADVDSRDDTGTTAFTSAIIAPIYIYRTLQRATFDGSSHFDELRVKSDIERRVISTRGMLVENGGRHHLFHTDYRNNSTLHQSASQCLGTDGADTSIGSGVLRFLAEYGVSPTLRNDDNLLPIHLAVMPKTCNITSLTYFLDHGANPNDSSPDGKKLITHTFTCAPLSLPVISLLLERGATVDSSDVWILFFEVVNPQPVLFGKILTLLVIRGAGYGATGRQCVMTAAHHGLLGVMRDMCDTGVGINTALCKKGGRRYRSAIQGYGRIIAGKWGQDVSCAEDRGEENYGSRVIGYMGKQMGGGWLELCDPMKP